MTTRTLFDERFVESDAEVESTRAQEEAERLHNEIEVLQRRLHESVGAAQAMLRRADELLRKQEGTVRISSEALKDLVALANQSPDLLARSAVDWHDRIDPTAIIQPFNEQIIKDLGGRNDLNFSDIQKVINNLCLDEYYFEREDHDENVLIVLVRALVRDRESPLSIESWIRFVPWNRLEASDVRWCLNGLVEMGMSAAHLAMGEQHNLPGWILRMAPHAYPDPLERLQWIAECVAPESDGEFDRSIGDRLHESISDWFREIPFDDWSTVLRSLRYLNQIAQSNLNISGEFEEASKPEGMFDGFSMKEYPVKILQESLEETVRTSVSVDGVASDALHEIPDWLRSVATVVYPDVVDRINWFFKTFSESTISSARLDHVVVEGILDSVGGWITETKEAPLEDLALVLRAIKRYPIPSLSSPSVWEEDIERLNNALRSKRRTKS